MKNPSTLIGLVASAWLGLLIEQGAAAPVFATDQVLGAGFTVSDDDLLQTSLSSGPSATLYDGEFGRPGTVIGFFDGPEGVLLSEETLTFQLDLAASPLGYDISGIATYAGWDEGRDGQAYELLYSSVADPGTFVTLAVIGEFPAGSQFGGQTSSTRIQITDDADEYLATGVAALRFVFGNFENGNSVYREIDVLGVAVVPEPASLVLLGLAILGFYGARRQD